MTNHESWMRLALEEAHLALAEGEVPVGAVLVRDNVCIARDHNRREQCHDPTAHAELLVLRQGAEALGDWRLHDCTLYVTLEPCPMCAGGLLMGRVGCCVFGAPDAGKGCCGSVYDLPADPALGGEMTWAAGVCEEECAALLKQFFGERRLR